MPSAEKSATGVSLMALTQPAHSDEEGPPRWKGFLVMTFVVQDSSVYAGLIQQHVSIYNHCWHLCPSIPFYVAAAFWCHRCALKINLYLKHQHYDTVACSSSKPRGRVRESTSSVDYGCVLELEGLLCASHMIPRSGCCRCV
jgi:hypothetical protein